MATQKQIAEHLDLSTRSIADLQALGVVPKGGDLDAARVAYIRHLREKAAGRGAGPMAGGLDLAQERAALARSQRTKIDLEIEVLQKTLIPAEQIEREWADIVASARAKLLAIPTRGASLVLAAEDRAEAEQILKSLVYEALDELARDGGADADQGREEDGAPDLEPAPQPDRKRVGQRKPPAKRGKQRGTRAVQ